MESILVVFNLGLVFLIVVSLVAWYRLLRDRWSGTVRLTLETLLPQRPRPRPFWSPVDALVMLGSMLLITQLMMSWMIAQGWIPQAALGDIEAKPQTATGVLAKIAAVATGGLCSIAIALAWLRLFDRDARQKVGLTLCKADIRLGLQSAFLILPPVLLINAGVVYFVPYEHDVLESMAAMATPVVFAATFIGTAVVTPLVEEFLLRGLLQGGLQGIAAHQSSDTEAWRAVAFWPVVAASLIFSLLHLGQGGAPIPLFFLSLGLGYLYRQTGSLAPSIVVHMVLNGLTLVVEIVRQSLTPW